MITFTLVVVALIATTYFISFVLNKQYIITSFDNDNNYQIAHINIVDYYDEKSDYIVDERKYLNISFVSFTLFILYIFVQNKNNSKRFFEKYFNKHYKLIVY